MSVTGRAGGLIVVDCTRSSEVVRLPPPNSYAATRSLPTRVMLTGISTGNVCIVTVQTDPDLDSDEQVVTISGAANYTLSNLWQAVQLESTGTQWVVTGGAN